MYHKISVQISCKWQHFCACECAKMYEDWSFIIPFRSNASMLITHLLNFFCIILLYMGNFISICLPIHVRPIGHVGRHILLRITSVYIWHLGDVLDRLLCVLLYVSLDLTVVCCAGSLVVYCVLVRLECVCFGSVATCTDVACPEVGTHLKILHPDRMLKVPDSGVRGVCCGSSGLRTWNFPFFKPISSWDARWWQSL